MDATLHRDLVNVLVDHVFNPNVIVGENRIKVIFETGGIMINHG